MKQATHDRQLTMTLNVKMDKADMVFGKVLRQDYQLLLDPEKKSFLPWEFDGSKSGALDRKKSIFFAKWDHNDSFEDFKLINDLPIDEHFLTVVRIYAKLKQTENDFLTYNSWNNARSYAL